MLEFITKHSILHYGGNLNTFAKKQALEILLKVKQISETVRNPEWGNNKKRRLGGAVCNSAAAPKDLGATKRNQNKVRQMRNLVKLGFLKEINYNNSGFPYFRLTDAGEKYLTQK